MVYLKHLMITFWNVYKRVELVRGLSLDVCITDDHRPLDDASSLNTFLKDIEDI
jgi:hypothetical protein